MPFVRPLLSLFAVAVLVAGCGTRDPYVYVENEFDRERPDFAVDPQDIVEVGICYNAQATTAATVRKMAVLECGRFGRNARFRDNEYLVCPLAVPVLAHFDCVKR